MTIIGAQLKSETPCRKYLEIHVSVTKAKFLELIIINEIEQSTYLLQRICIVMFITRIGSLKL